MAKFKKARRFARRSFGKARRYGKSNKGINPIEVAAGSAVYGVARPYAANILPDVPQLGGYSDNVILGCFGALAAWKGKGMIKKAGMIVLANESFIAASRMTQGIQTSGTSSSGVYIN